MDELYSISIPLEATSPDTPIENRAVAYIGEDGVHIETYEGIGLTIPYESLKKVVTHPKVEERLDEVLELGF